MKFISFDKLQLGPYGVEFWPNLAASCVVCASALGLFLGFAPGNEQSLYCVSAAWKFLKRLLILFSWHLPFIILIVTYLQCH